MDDVIDIDNENLVDYSNSITTDETSSIISATPQPKQIFENYGLFNNDDSSLNNTLNYGNDISYLSEVINSIKNIVSCSACFSSLTPMKECSNGHLICQSCYLILRQLERPQCPICRIGLHSEPKTALVAENVMAELPETCKNCEILLSRKNLSIHNESICPRRKISCTYFHLGCKWIGTADEANNHVINCKINNDKCLKDIADYVSKKEQAWNEIFQSFFSVLKRLESTEPQYRAIALSFIKSTSDYLTFKSDQFHCNQSRWSLEVRFYQQDNTDENYSSDTVGYRFTKENGIGTSRKFYGFVLLSLRCDDNIKMSLKPQLNFVKFLNRGQITEFFSAYNVDQKFKPRNYHILYADIGIIRKTEDNDD